MSLASPLGLGARALGARVPSALTRSNTTRPAHTRRHGLWRPGQSRNITSKWASLDHSVAHANIRDRPRLADWREGPAPAIWIEELKCYQQHQYYTRHARAADQRGYIKTGYVARRDSAQAKACMMPLLIIYLEDCVPGDGHFWPETRMLCDFAAAITEAQMDPWSRFHYNLLDPDEPWHITCSLTNRQTWNKGLGYIREGYHVYAKDEDIFEGYGGWCLSSLRPSANAKFNTPASVLPHIKPVGPGLFVANKNHLRTPKSRSRLLQPMSNIVPVPVVQLRDGLPPRTMGQWPPCLTHPHSIRARKNCVKIARAWRLGLRKSGKEGVDSPVPGDGAGNAIPMDEAVRKALESGDPAVEKWALLQFNNAADLVTTVGGSLRPPQSLITVGPSPTTTRSSPTTTRSSPTTNRSSPTTNRSSPTTDRSSPTELGSNRPTRAAQVRKGALEFARAVLRAHRESLRSSRSKRLGRGGLREGEGRRKSTNPSSTQVARSQSGAPPQTERPAADPIRPRERATRRLGHALTGRDDENNQDGDIGGKTALDSAAGFDLAGQAPRGITQMRGTGDDATSNATRPRPHGPRSKFLAFVGSWLP